MNIPHPPVPGFLRRTFAGNFIDFQGLPVTLKILTISGYIIVFGLLFFTLLVELAGNYLQTVPFLLNGQYYKVPLAVMAITSLAFIVGWAYLLTGAAATGRARVFLPTMALFSLQLFVASPAQFNPRQFLLLFLFEALFFLTVTVIYGLTRRTRFWRDFPSLYFFGWLGIVTVFIILLIGTAGSNAGVAIALSTNLNIVLILTLLFWVVLGLSVVDLGIRIGRACTRITRRYLPSSTFNAMTILVLLIHPPVNALVFWLVKDGLWFVDFTFSLLLILSALALWITRRWSTSTSAVLLTLSLASPVVILGVSMALVGQDFTQLLLEMTGIFPPLLLFVGLTTYNLLGAGVSFTSVDGHILPRNARILLYFGILILVVTSILFQSNVRNAETNQPQEAQSLINNLFALSVWVLGIPYVFWLVWKRREVLTGAEGEFLNAPRWIWLDRVPGNVWFALSLTLACCTSCLMAGILYLII